MMINTALGLACEISCLSFLLAVRKVLAGDISWIQPRKFHNNDMIQVLHKLVVMGTRYNFV